jgi:hypothetical protein
LCFDPDKQTGIIISVDRLPECFPKVRRFREDYDPDCRIVNSWLDSRLQDDFLEARTLKYAIVLEALCRLVEARHHDIPSKYVKKMIWRSAGTEFLPRIKDHLRTFQIDTDVIEGVCSNSNWGNLNRASFRTTIVECLRRLGIEMHDGPERIRRVTDVRNKIVHSSNYLTAEEFKELKEPAIDHTGQHFLIACFVDEVLLRLFGLGDHVSESWIADFLSHRSRQTQRSASVEGQ